MAVEIIELLEVVDVEHEQRGFHSISRGPLQTAGRALHEVATVADTGQGISVGKSGQNLLSLGKPVASDMITAPTTGEIAAGVRIAK